MVSCEIGGKPPSAYPNWIISKDHSYHVGCMAEAYENLKASPTLAELMTSEEARELLDLILDEMQESLCPNLRDALQQRAKEKP